MSPSSGGVTLKQIVHSASDTKC